MTLDCQFNKLHLKIHLNLNRSNQGSTINESKSFIDI